MLPFVRSSTKKAWRKLSQNLKGLNRGRRERQKEEGWYVNSK